MYERLRLSRLFPFKKGVKNKKKFTADRMGHGVERERRKRDSATAMATATVIYTNERNGGMIDRSGHPAGNLSWKYHPVRES